MCKYRIDRSQTLPVNRLVTIREKCKRNVSKAECEACIDIKEKICWGKIICTLIGRNIKTHNIAEIADGILHWDEKNVYFVIKSEKISGGKGDNLYRQCVDLFNHPNSIIIYLNPNDTPDIILNKIVQGKLPAFIKKWQTFAVADENRGVKGYNLIMAEKGSADEAMLEISKLIAPFWRIEGFAMKLEPLLTVKDSLKVIGKSL